MKTRRTFLASSAAAAAPSATGAWPARADNAPGITDTEIKIGQTMPYSGPASAYGVIGKTETAYFKMINDAGGVNGRKINLISLDDGYSPPKTVEQVRRLVEQEQVAFLFNTPGHAAATPRSGNISTTTRCRSCSSPPGPRCSAIPSISLDDRLPAELSDRGDDFRQAYLADQARRQDRRALSERRLRQGLSDRAEGRASARNTPAWWSRKSPTRFRSRRSNSQIVTLQGAGVDTSALSPRRRNSRRRRSARPTTSAGLRCAT